MLEDGIFKNRKKHSMKASHIQTYTNRAVEVIVNVWNCVLYMAKVSLPLPKSSLIKRVDALNCCLQGIIIIVSFPVDL